MRHVFCTLLLCFAIHNCMAFDWKPQTNERLRSDMIAFARQFEQETKGTPAAKLLHKFVRQQERKAKTDAYAWIGDTYDIVAKLKAIYPPLTNDDSTASLIRKRTLQLLDYPIHVNNRAPNINTAEKEAFEKNLDSYLLQARQRALAFLAEPAPADGKLALCKVYNMGYILRTSRHTVIVDLCWEGTSEEAAFIASKADAFFLTHNHGDHFSKIMLQTLLDAGKTVVVPNVPVGKLQSDKFYVLDEELTTPRSIAGIDVVTMRGQQGVEFPNNVYLFDIDGWRIIHQGDNEIREKEAHVADYDVADIVIAASWNKIHNILGAAMKAKGADQRPPLFIPSHENEKGHGVDHRESYHELFDRADRLGDATFHYPPFMLLDIGETYLFSK
ncbi:MAG: MBL fold metallo-hydrolase [Bacteroidales bacterium]|nr:MBL fold metallo-hydrolase [Bacteroidales bacterium]